MSAHKVLFDLYKAPYEKFLTPDAGFSLLEVDRQDTVFPINSTVAAVALTLAAPTKAGMRCDFCCTGYANSCVVTVTNYDGTTYALTFTGAPKQAFLKSVPVSVSSPLALNQNNSVQGNAENYNWIVTFANL